MEWEKIERGKEQSAITAAIRHGCSVEVVSNDGDVREVILHAAEDTVRIYQETYTALRVYRIKPPETLPGIAFHLKWKGKLIMAPVSCPRKQHTLDQTFRDALRRKWDEGTEVLDMPILVREAFESALMDFDWFNRNPEEDCNTVTADDWELHINFFRFIVGEEDEEESNEPRI